MPTNLFILVFVASPLDYARYRHTALYFEFASQEQAADDGAEIGTEEASSPDEIMSSLMEVVGSPGLLRFSDRMNTDLSVSSTSK